MVRLLAGWLPMRAFPYFKAYYQAQIEVSLIKHMSALPGGNAERLRPGQHWYAEKGELRELVEIHQREEWNQQVFCWAKPIFAVPVDVSGLEAGELCLNLTLPQILEDLKSEKIVLISSWRDNDPVFPRIVQDKAGMKLTFEFPPPVDEESATRRGNEWLVIVSPAIKGNPKEQRELGLPLAAVSLSEGW